MQRDIITVSLKNGEAEKIKKKMLNWANQFSIVLFLDSNNYQTVYGAYECLIAADALDTATTLEEINSRHNEHRTWLFGHISYDYKNVLEPKLSTRHGRRHAQPLLHFFNPRTVCYIDKEQRILTIETSGNARHVLDEIMQCSDILPRHLPQLTFERTVSREAYIDTIQQLRRHIADGDCYEINYCVEAASRNTVVDPLAVYNRLNELSPAPYAAYYKLHQHYLLCASPERYIRRVGSKIISQPIKGTARRSNDTVTDEAIKHELQNSVKERAENVMIADLVRNDLARVCETGSIEAEELFGIYSFPQVHQMISTISGRLQPGADITAAIRSSFPMGSMTGAPKHKVMQLTDAYEQSARELYSGTVGYITPDGDFDFNVVIRSLFYNAEQQYLSYHTGGAITYDSVAENEWDEMRLKAWAMERIFS